MLTIGRFSYPDATAVVQEPRLEIVEHYVWTGEPHDNLLPRLADLLREVWRVQQLAVDSTGLGETIARLLTTVLGSHIVRLVRFTQESKSRLGYGLLAATNGGRLKVYAADGSIDSLPRRNLNATLRPCESSRDTSSRVISRYSSRPWSPQSSSSSSSRCCCISKR